MANFLDIIKGEGLAVQLIKSLVNTGIATSQILQQVRDAGLGIRTQTGYQVVNYLKNISNPGQETLQSISALAYPNIKSIPLSLTKLLRNFSYRVKVSGTHQLTGELVDQYIQISSNQLLTKQAALDQANAIVSVGGTKYPLKDITSDVTEILQNNAGLISIDSPLNEPPSIRTIGFGSGAVTRPTTLPFGYASWADYYTDTNQAFNPFDL